MSGFQHAKSQHEASLRWAGDACHSMACDLDLERGKVRELESRLAELHPTIETVISRLSASEKSDSSRETRQLQRENERQRDLIRCLQATLRAREESVRELEAALGAAAGGFLHSRDEECSMDVASCGELICMSQDEDSSVDIVTEASPGPRLE